MLDERKLRAIELRTKGKGNTEIAVTVGVSRTSVYNWFQEAEVKAELARFEREIKTHGMNRFNGQLDIMVDGAFELALHADSEKVRADMLQYCINRSLGNTTSKIELNDKTEQELLEIDILDVELSEVDDE